MSTGLLLALAGLVVVACALTLLWWRRQRAAKTTIARLRRASEDLLSGVLIPNADTEQIHLDFAILTRKDIVVVDVREVTGNVFGSESMQEWTVLDGGRRFTFPNPLPVLYDRVAAVRRLLPDTPVSGRVVFTARAQFSKGLPPDVVMLDAFITELAAQVSASDAPKHEELGLAWSRLRSLAVASTV